MDDIPEDIEPPPQAQGEPMGMVAVPTQVLSLAKQSELALQQLAVVVGVALLVGGCFMLMIGLELGLAWLEERCQKLCGGKRPSEEVLDPAAMVGSFKRYK